MPNEDAVSLIARVRAFVDEGISGARPPSEFALAMHEANQWAISRANLRILCALAEQGMVWERMFTDEQAAHAMTAANLTNVIRLDGKAEQYRVERDKARKALREILGAWDAMDATDPNAETTTEEYTRAFDAVLNRGRAATQEVPDAE